MANDKFVSAFEVGAVDYYVKDATARQLISQISSQQSTIASKLDKSTFETFKAEYDVNKEKLKNIQVNAKNVLWADWDLQQSGAYTDPKTDWVLKIVNKPTKLSQFEDDITGIMQHQHNSTSIITDAGETLADVISTLKGSWTAFEYGSVKDAENTVVKYDTVETIKIPKRLGDLEDGEELDGLGDNLHLFRERFGLNTDLTPKTEEEKGESNDILQTDDVYAEGTFDGTTFTPALDYTHWGPVREIDTGGNIVEHEWYQQTRPNVTTLFNNNLSPVNTINKKELLYNDGTDSHYIGNRPVEAWTIAEELDHYVKADGDAAYYGDMQVGLADEALNIAGDVNTGGKFIQRKTGGVADIMDHRKTLQQAGASFYKGSISNNAEYKTKIFDKFDGTMAPFKNGYYWNVTGDFTTFEGVEYKKGDFILNNGRDDATTYVKRNFRQFKFESNASIESLRGNTIVWNQLLPATGSTSSGTWIKGKSYSSAKAATIAKVDDRTLSITVPKSTTNKKTKKTTYGIVAWKRNKYFTPISNHKYYISMTISTSQPIDFLISDSVGTSRANVKYNNQIISGVWSFQEISMLAYDFAFRNKTTSTCYVTLKDFMIMDLSLMFGLGNEPDAGEFKRMFPSTWYAYTGKNGKFIDVNLTDKSRYISQSYQCWDGSYEEQATKLVSKNIPVMPSQQYVFQWLSRDNINTGGVRLIKYYDAGDGSALVNMGTSVVSSSDFFTTGNANLIVMEIDAIEGRTLAQAKNNLDRIRITPYNAYNSKVTDTEYWYQSKQLVPNGVTESLKSTPSTYDEVSKTMKATRIGKGTITLTANGSLYNASCTWTDGDPANGSDYVTSCALARELGSISNKTLTPVSSFNSTKYPGFAGTYTIYYRLASAKSEQRSWDIDWDVEAGYNGTEYFFYDGTNVEAESTSFYDSLSESTYVDRSYSTIYPLIHEHGKRINKVPHDLTIPASAPLSVNILYDYDTARSVSKLVSFPDMRFGSTVLTSAKSKSYSNTTISFGHTFENIPQVFITPINSTRKADFGDTSYHVSSRSRSQFTVTYSNNSSNDHNTWISWMAVDTAQNFDANVSDLEDIEVPEYLGLFTAEEEDGTDLDD